MHLDTDLAFKIPMKTLFNTGWHAPILFVWICVCGAQYLPAQPAIYSYDPSGNPLTVTVGAAGSPSIAGQPTSALLQPNGTTTFSVNATGVGLTYQWLSNGVPIIGANSDSLVLGNLALIGTNLGYFSVIVSNTAGLSVTSSPAALWPDANGNGIPDWWEMYYFGNLNQTADGDHDGDCVDNLKARIPRMPPRSIRVSAWKQLTEPWLFRRCSPITPRGSS